MVRPKTDVVELPYKLPPLGDNPSTERQGTTPGSFANGGRVGTPWMFSSPETPGMPQPSEKTAWDFLPDGWSSNVSPAVRLMELTPELGFRIAWIRQADGAVRDVIYPANFVPITQL